ncbi:MAG: DUF2007 domain-containing protein [Candidatus Thiodiazotropha taylori]|nr:DUF2007 domain-containing protein [Candidatus Thiodiazotropha taylori]
MIELFQAQDRIEAQMLKDYLQDQGIETVILNDHLSGALGELPANIFPTLWLLEDQDLSKARKLKQQFLNLYAPKAAAWRCPACGEQIDGGYEICWNCSTPGPKDNNKE